MVLGTRYNLQDVQHLNIIIENHYDKIFFLFIKRL